MKNALAYFLGFILVSGGVYSAHFFLISEILAPSPIAIFHLYLFFGGFSFLLCILLLYLSKTEKFKDQIGFLYLVSVALKIALFCFAFSRVIFSETSFSNLETINLLIPMTLNIILETFFISKILKNMSHLKNAN